MNHIPKKGLILFAIIGLGFCAKAQHVLKLADEQYQLYNYFNAADLYEKAYRAKPTLYAVQQLASSYHQLHDYKNEESWYALAVKMSPVADNFFNYAIALQNNAKYGEAKVNYEKYASLNQKSDKSKILSLIASCDSAVKWMQHPGTEIITNQRQMNSIAADWGVTIYKDAVMFASDRGVTNQTTATYRKPFLKFVGNDKPDRKIYGWTGNSYLKLYKAIPADTSSTTAKLFFEDALTIYHTGPASFDNDGKGMYYTIDNPVPSKIKSNATDIETVKLKIFYARKDATSGKWLPPTAFKYNKAGFSTGDPFITADGKRLYFVSDMPGGKGGTDLYYCWKLNDGTWSDPINIAELNTTGNERTPMLDSSGNFYYATDGNITMGGLDIYRASYVGDKFINAQNMGYPINSPQDDFAYQSLDGKSGYLSSNRIGGMGSDDIYRFNKKPPFVLKLEGITYDKTSHQPVAGSLVTLTNNNFLINFTTDGIGRFSFTLVPDMDYELKGEKTGYTGDATTLTTNGLKVSQTLQQDLYLERIKINEPIVLQNINYDFDKYNIRSDAQPALDHLIKVMADNPTIWIELGSHTDSRGSDKYNLALSERRAQSAVTYIINKGHINGNRIIAKGYGESRLLNGCGNGVNCTEQEHQVNRRTEFKITKQ